MLILLQKSKIKIYEKVIFLGLSLPPSKRLSSKKISNTKLHFFFVKFLSTLLLSLSLSLKHITRNGEIYCWWLAQLFRPLLKKRVFQPKIKKYVLLIIKQGKHTFWSV